MRSIDRLLDGTTKRRWLLIALAMPIVLQFGSAELWTQEGRWGLICQQMLRSGDLLHPSLLGEPYYGKPLLSYWLMVLFAFAAGELSETALRLPSVLAGLLTVWFTLRIGERLFDVRTSRLAAALLATSYMFVFWSRVASADALQVAGMMAAIDWYVARRERSDWRSHLGWCAILAVASLAKSPAAAVMAVLVIAPDLWGGSRWRRHLRIGAALSAAAGAALFLAPFVLARGTATSGQDQASLWTLFRENVVRYFAPFDHGGPVWLYCVQLPVYLLPWGLVLPWLGWRMGQRRRTLHPSARWLGWGLGLVFLFLTGCGSRRSYYSLPMLPLASLLLAHGLQSWASEGSQRLLRRLLVATWALLVVWFGIAVPWSSQGETTRRNFAADVRRTATQRAPWGQWRVLSIDAVPAASFYLQAVAEPDMVEQLAEAPLRTALATHPRTVVLSRRRHLDELRRLLPGAQVLEQPAPRFGGSREGGADLLVALLP